MNNKASFYYKVNALVIKINREVNIVLGEFDYKGFKDSIEEEIINKLLSCDILICDNTEMPYVSAAADIRTRVVDTISCIAWETDTCIVDKIDINCIHSYTMRKLINNIKCTILQLFIEDGLLADFVNDKTFRLYL